MDEEYLKQLGDYILVETPLAKADMCLLFGNPHADHLAAGAADLYDEGYFKRIVVSGGVATDDGRLEAHRMRDVLLGRGLPERDIIVEDRAQSTIENVIYSMHLLENAVGLKNIRALLAIGHLHASRRFLMTLERHWPEVIKMFKTSNCYGVPPSRWQEHAEFRKGVLSEEETIGRFLRNDFIREIDLEKQFHEIAKLLR